MLEQIPFVERYTCSAVQKTVTISGLELTLRSSSDQSPVDSKRVKLSCSGSPACGHIFKGEDCPYPEI